MWFKTDHHPQVKEAIYETESIIKSYLIGLLIQITYMTILLGGILLIIALLLSWVSDSTLMPMEAAHLLKLRYVHDQTNYGSGGRTVQVYDLERKKVNYLYRLKVFTHDQTTTRFCIEECLRDEQVSRTWLTDKGFAGIRLPPITDSGSGSIFV